jgi:hypothetical protein
MATIVKPVEYYYQLAPYNLAASIALPILDVVVVALRIFARRKQHLPLMIDDWLTIPALVSLYLQISDRLLKHLR